MLWETGGEDLNRFLSTEAVGGGDLFLLGVRVELDLNLVKCSSSSRILSCFSFRRCSLSVLLAFTLSTLGREADFVRSLGRGLGLKNKFIDNLI